MTRVKLFAHRGSSRICPENTMTAFRQAKKEGADGIEIDVQLSKDGYPVVIHDRTVTRTTNGHGVVSQLTLKQLRRLDAGSWYNAACRGEKIPTLDEVLSWLKTNELQLNIELKTDEEPHPGIEQTVLEAIKRTDLRDRIILSSFRIDTLDRVRKLDSTIPLALLVWEKTDGVVEIARSLGTDLHCRVSFMQTVEAVKAVQQGITVRLYTVNDVEELQRIDLAGVEGVFTDTPSLLRRVMSKSVL